MKISQEMREAAADHIASKPIASVFPKAPEQVRQGWCPAPGCGSVADRLKDDLSIKEFMISGMCQECQDSFFRGGDINGRT